MKRVLAGFVTCLMLVSPIITQASAGVISPQFTYLNTIPTDSILWAVNDVTGDGYPDLISGSDDDIAVRPGNNDGSFGNPRTTTIPNTTFYYQVAYADFNKDKRTDFVLGDTEGNRRHILYGQSDGTFRVQTLTVNYSSGINTTGDFNQDGYDDLIINGSSSGYWIGFGSTSGVNAVEDVPSKHKNLVAFGKTLARGKPGFSGSSFYITAYNDGKKFTDIGGPSGIYCENSDRPFIADFNSDGFDDAIGLCGLFDTNLFLTLGSDLGYGNPVKVVSKESDWARYATGTVGDFNGDRTPDFAILDQTTRYDTAGSSYKRFGILTSLGNGTFATVEGKKAPILANRIFAADLNSDGYSDLILGDSGKVAIVMAQDVIGAKVLADKAEADAQAAADAKSAADFIAKQQADAQAAADKAAVIKKKTITCLKGKTTKKVTGLAPKCPSGYKKK